ncbi:MAG TPA: hypothetical protein VIJ29_02475 [Candidatus Paceibacterota bacterium]
MNLRGIPFGNVLGASGVQGFFGEGYRYHRYLQPFGLNFGDVTFVAKTTTLDRETGHMELRDDFTPVKFFPDCIYVKPWQGNALNAIALSGPGVLALLEKGYWQARTKPFFISFMSVARTKQGRLDELEIFVRYVKRYIPRFRAPFGLQINYSCPNVGVGHEDLVDEARQGLSIASHLDIPLMPKFSVVLPPQIAKAIGEDPLCDALCISNTVKFGQLPDRIDWVKLFGPVSPLAHYGGGGLSGKPLLPLLLEWLTEIRSIGFTKPINAGGGILSISDAIRVLRTNADSIFLGSIAFLRPWRVRKIGRVIGHFQE